MSDDAKIDLGPLDPRQDRARWEARIAAIERAAAPALAQRRGRSTIWDVLAWWRRPLLGFAAGTVLVTGVSLAIVGRRQGAREERGILQFEKAMVDWARRGDVPPPQEVLMFGRAIR